MTVTIIITLILLLLRNVHLLVLIYGFLGVDGPINKILFFECLYFSQCHLPLMLGGKILNYPPNAQGLVVLQFGKIVCGVGREGWYKQRYLLI